MTTIAEIRAQYPQYDDLSDQQLADALHSKFYSDMPVEEFKSKIGMVNRGHSNVPAYIPPGVEGYNPETGLVEQKGQGALGTFMTAGAEGVPIIGGALDKAALNISAGLGSMMTGGSFAGVRDEMQEMRDKGRKEHPIAHLGGNVAGGIVSMAPIASTAAGARVLGITGPSFGARTAAAGLSSAGIAGADTLARGGSIEDAGKSALFAGGVGMALPAIGRALSQRGSGAARAAAPTVESLRDTGSQLYREAFDAGVSLKPKAFDGAIMKMASELRSFGFDADLHPGSTAVLRRLAEARGRPIDLQELDILRRVAQNATKGQNASDATAARIIIEKIDDLVDDATNFALGRGNSLAAPGAGAKSASDGLEALTKARATWHTMRKSETIEELFRRAEIKSGVNTGPEFAMALQREFKSLALRKNGLRGFTKAERRAIENVAKKVDARNFPAILGRFMQSMGGSGVGGAAGFALGGGPVGAGFGFAATGMVGKGLERFAQNARGRASINAAERAAAMIRSNGALNGANYGPSAVAPLETALRAAPLVTHDRR
ncbi:hypothetical protein [Mesorhizobium sp. ANAO-SY3R2]|uniref:hypothetical protein n=1 Tax=Mesorhizobium sp. ANAO-SY3R2 TaxID=3166644 RepID=UPI0036701EDA